MYADPKRFRFSWRKQVILNLLLSSVLVLQHNMSFFFSGLSSATPLWSSTGISLAAIVLFGFQTVLPGIVLGSLLLAIQLGASSFTTTGVFLCNVVEPAIAAMLLFTYGKSLFRLKNLKDIFIFVLYAALFVPFIFCTTNIAFMFAGKIDRLADITDAWLTLFASDILSVLIFTPLTVSFFYKREIKANSAEVMGIFTLLLLVTSWSMEGSSTKVFLILPCLTWISIRFSFRGVAISAILLSFIALWRSSVPDILWIQSVAGGTALVGYFLATVKEEQERARAKELESYINLEHKRIAEEALAILDQSIQKSPIGYSLIDRNHCFMRINEKMAELDGEPGELHLGRSVQEMMPGLAADIENKVQQVFTSGESLLNTPIKVMRKGKPDELISGLLSYYPVRHPISNIVFGVAISFQDMTEQLKIQELLEQNQARLHYAQEASKSGAFEWNLETSHIIWTPEMERIYGLARGEFNGSYQSWMKLIHHEDLEGVKHEIRKALNGADEMNFQFRIITKKYDVRWILARAKKMVNQQGHGQFVGINIDLTEQKNSEQKLRMTEANLLHALSVRDEFMATASHELKTPLTSLKLQTELYQKGMTKGDPTCLTEARVNLLLERNGKQIDRLTRLVDDMLDISRMRTGQLSLKKENCELNAILKDILLRTKEQFEKSGSGMPEVEYTEESKGNWDSLRIEQVITNIITNSLRYGRGRPISIAIKNYPESVRLSVKDQGLGIAKSDQKRIFQRYERGLLAREVSGLGLGLFICQQIVTAHGGKIWVESEINQGATFYVDLPRTVFPNIAHLGHDLVEA